MFCIGGAKVTLVNAGCGLKDFFYAMEWLWQNIEDHSILNLSLGFSATSDSTNFDCYLKGLIDRGIYIVQAAPNEPVTNVPVAHPDMIIVGSTDNKGRRIPTHSFSSNITLYAPSKYQKTNRKYVQGTSYSASLVSGHFAQMLEEAHKVGDMDNVTPFDAKRRLLRDASTNWWFRPTQDSVPKSTLVKIPMLADWEGPDGILDEIRHARASPKVRTRRSASDRRPDRSLANVPRNITPTRDESRPRRMMNSVKNGSSGSGCKLLKDLIRIGLGTALIGMFL